MLKDSGDSLDDEATYLNLFEELQYTFSPSSFSELTPSQVLDEDKIAAFVARTRGYKHGITIKCRMVRPLIFSPCDFYACNHRKILFCRCRYCGKNVNT